LAAADENPFKVKTAMIAYVQGRLTAKTPTAIVVETGGIGLQLTIPLSTYEALGEVGREVRVLSYLHVREDALQLFGFSTENERRLFLLLLSVTGIGPKVAQGILSGISVDGFESAVRRQDVPALVKVPGVGKKTAERLVLELRDKIGEIGTGGSETVLSGRSGILEEAVLALVSLGYKRAQAQEAVQAVIQGEAAPALETVLRRALQRMTR
jgi:holliday junction DNA helicase RuvA